jgi:hypothetical protein
MVPGFNTNIEWRGVLFHLQSEDSGRSHPHIISHLYHGGTILASEKQSYAEHVDVADLTAVVRELMEAQHEELLGRLRQGAFDPLIEERLGNDVFGEPPPAQLAAEAKEEFEELLTVVAADEDTNPVMPLDPNRPLDEWVLDYLIQSAQRRKAQS